MADENILAIRLSTPEPQQRLPWDGVPFEHGWRAVMSVRMIRAKVQTTILYGDSLYMIWYNIGSMSPQEGFSFFLKDYYNTPMTYGQLSQPPYAAIPGRYRRLVPTPPPPPPTAIGVMTILNSGFDPFYGYWVEVAGNYFLTMPLFKDWKNVIRDGPDFKGFQSSQNNSGSGTSGQGC